MISVSNKYDYIPLLNGEKKLPLMKVLRKNLERVFLDSKEFQKSRSKKSFMFRVEEVLKIPGHCKAQYFFLKIISYERVRA